MGAIYTPPFKLNSKIFNLSLEIQDILGQLKNAEIAKPSVKLRKENQIKTIHHSLAIEGNTLSIAQITDIINDKKIIGPQKQITEVINAIHLYECISDFDATSENSFLKAHKILMTGLVQQPGHYRKSNVGVIKGSQLKHVAPQAKQVALLMNQLFNFLKKNKETTLIVKACVFHYELEFIHPFEDGNGRMGRLWQQIVLMKYSPVFEYLSVESLVFKNQQKYYKVLEACDKAGESTLFIEFALNLILQELISFKKVFKPQKIDVDGRLSLAKDKFRSTLFSRKKYMEIFPEISTATASRDLNYAMENEIMEMVGERNQAQYKFRQ